MSRAALSPLPEHLSANRCRVLARRIAEAHRTIDAASLLAFSSTGSNDGSIGQAPEVELCIAFRWMPIEARLADACTRGGAGAWLHSEGASSGGRFSVQCRSDGIGVRIGYFDHQALNDALDATLAEHGAAAARQGFGRSILNAEPLAGHAELARLQARLTRLTPKVACAMVKRFLSTPTPWRAISQIGERDAALWCRELQVDACYRLCGVRAALSQRYFTRFQVKRQPQRAPRFENAPAGLGERIERLMQARPREAFAQLFALEGEVLAMVAREMPQINLATVQASRAAYGRALA